MKKMKMKKFGWLLISCGTFLAIGLARGPLHFLEGSDWATITALAPAIGFCVLLWTSRHPALSLYSKGWGAFVIIALVTSVTTLRNSWLGAAPEVVGFFFSILFALSLNFSSDAASSTIGNRNAVGS